MGTCRNIRWPLAVLAGRLAVIAIACLISRPAWAQDDLPEGLAPVPDVPDVAVAAQEDKGESDESTAASGLEGKGKYEGGAILKTDPELQSRLNKAAQYQKDGNYRVATRLWQSVLDDCGDTLYTSDEETYFSLSRQIEALLAGLPAEGLSAYRIAADATAAGIIAARPENDLEALGKVVRYYFLSSQGDDAAMRIGCILLDRGDFGGARRMFSRIIEQYPDPDVGLDQVWLRMAAASCLTGDQAGAKEALAHALEAGGDPDEALYRAIEDMIAGVESGSASLAGQFTSQERAGSRVFDVLPSIADPPSGKLRIQWQWYYAVADRYRGEDAREKLLDDNSLEAHAATVRREDENSFKLWRASKWRPIPGLIFDGKNFVWRSAADIVGGRFGDKGLPEVVWRPLWLNLFEVDKASQSWKQMMDTYGQYGETSSQASTAPARSSDIRLFGDGIATSISVIDGMVYVIEGREYSPWTKITISPRPSESYSWGSIPRRSRTNFLTAYDADSGKLIWRQPGWSLPGAARTTTGRGPGVANPPVANDSIDESVAGKRPGDAQEGGAPNQDDGTVDPMLDVGFMGAPVKFGQVIVAPVTVAGSLYLYALEPDSGNLTWRVYLCDEPTNGSNFWSPVHISVGGSTVYATTGTGVVFAVDGVTGSIRMARRYPRTGKKNDLMARFGNPQQLIDVDGWCEDMVLPIGNEVLVLSSDYDAMWAMDSQTGKLIWRTDNRPFGQKFDYLIGIHDDLVYLGGRDAVAAVSLKGQGRWVWIYSLPDVSYGRAMLTADALYVPVGNTIAKLALAGKNGSGDLLGQWPVQLANSGPVGNLYTDGKQILVDGGSRLFGLVDDDRPVSEGPDLSPPEETSGEESLEVEKDGE